MDHSIVIQSKDHTIPPTLTNLSTNYQCARPTLIKVKNIVQVKHGYQAIRAIIHSLKLEDHLHVQAYRPLGHLLRGERAF